MARKFAVAAVSAALVALSPTAFADPSGGTAEEAKAILTKAVAAVKADKAKALDMFNKGEGGFLDRDLYVFCIDVVGKEVASEHKEKPWKQHARRQGLNRQGVWTGNL